MEGDGDHVCRRMRGGIAAASVANDIYAQVTAPSPYHHSASQQRHCTITTQCTITVPSLYHHCSITVPSLYHHCSITVPSLYHHCSITVPVQVLYCVYICCAYHCDLYVHTNYVQRGSAVWLWCRLLLFMYTYWCLCST